MKTTRPEKENAIQLYYNSNHKFISNTPLKVKAT